MYDKGNDIRKSLMRNIFFLLIRLTEASYESIFYTKRPSETKRKIM